MHPVLDALIWGIGYLAGIIGIFAQLGRLLHTISHKGGND